MFIRTAQFTFRPSSEENGLSLLREHTAFIAKSPGCIRAYLGTPIHGTSHIVYSEWRSEADVERMEASLQTNPAASGSFFGLMGLLQSPPHVARFQALD